MKKKPTLFKGNFKKKKKRKRRPGSRNSTGVDVCIPAAANGGSRSCQPPGSPGKGPVSPRPLLLDTSPQPGHTPAEGQLRHTPTPTHRDHEVTNACYCRPYVRLGQLIPQREETGMPSIQTPRDIRYTHRWEFPCVCIKSGSGTSDKYTSVN